MKNITIGDVKEFITEIVEREVRKTFKISDFGYVIDNLTRSECLKGYSSILMYDGVNIGTVDREGNFTPDERYTEKKEEKTFIPGQVYKSLKGKIVLCIKDGYCGDTEYFMGVQFGDCFDSDVQKWVKDCFHHVEIEVKN